MSFRNVKLHSRYVRYPRDVSCHVPPIYGRQTCAGCSERRIVRMSERERSRLAVTVG